MLTRRKLRSRAMPSGARITSDRIISSIFADGTDGFYIDFSRLSSMWQDTAGTIPVTTAGQNIARADDQSGNANNGTQSTTSSQPKYQTGGLSRFDGADDNLLTTLVPGAAMTLMFKGKVTSSSRVVIGAGNSGPTRNCYIGVNASGRIGGGVGSQSFSTIAGPSDVRGTTGVGALCNDGSVVKLYWDGVEVYSAAQAGTSEPGVALTLGAFSFIGTAGNFADADLYYALAIKTALSATQIAAITKYWRA